MPANLTPDYLAAEARFRAAETNEDKLAALDEMYATIPKHKGTEKLRADIKRRVSKLKEKERVSGKHGRHFDEFHIVREGAGQIALLGPANSGKSSLLARLTAAEPEIAEYPYTTRRPMPGMMAFEDVLVQLVDMPPVSASYTERAVIALARTADSIALVLDLSEDALLEQIEEIRAEMSKSRVVLAGEHAQDREPPPGVTARPGIVIANKVDLTGSVDNLNVLREFYGGEFGICPVSAVTGEGIDELRAALFGSLNMIRVYTKVPGKPPDMDKPFTLKRGSTLLDFAATVHKDFAHHLRMARAWGVNKLEGAQIGRDHVLDDGDVVELHG